MRNLSKVSVICSAILFGSVAYAAVPDEGSVIGNQATASYTDGSGQSKVTTSNLVETTVAKISGVSIISDQSKTVSVGGTVLFQHTVSNTGNGQDIFNLSATDVDLGNINFTNLVIYADADQNGVPDSNTPITLTPTINAGQSYGIIVSATIPNSAADSDSENISVTAVSNSNGAISDSLSDLVVVTGNAVIDVTKSLSVSTGASPSAAPITVTLTYTNTGDSAATSVEFEDALPAGMIYVPNSGNWSGTASTLTDAIGGDGVGIDYSVTGNTVTAEIASIASGASGIVTFQVDIAPLVAPGNVTNIANISYDDGSGAVVGPFPTNGAIYNVIQTASVAISDTDSVNDEDGALNDVVELTTPVSQGSTIVFDNKIFNNGNGSDTFELSIESGYTFPAGTIFQFFKSDGSAPLTDTNADGSPDTGSLAAGGSYVIKVKAILPSDYSGTNAGAGFELFVKAQSKFDNAVTDLVKNKLVEITESKVDLTNNAEVGNGSALGEGDGVEAAAVVSVSVNPSAIATFSLFANNLSGLQDDYRLEASTDPTFTTTTLPSGWGVVFKNGGSPITSTGNIAGGANLAITAEVSIPSSAVPSTQPLYFRVISDVTGAFDIIHDEVVVNAITDLSVSPNNTGQLFPAGTTIYAHTINNNGNVAIPSGVLTATNSESGWNAVVYHDANGNGILDAGDISVTDISDIGVLPAGGSFNMLIKVFSPSGSTQGTTNTTTLTISGVTNETNTTDNVATDSSTVITGDVSLDKKQAFDADCNGTIEGVFTSTPLSNAAPGSCVAYQIIATNTGSVGVESLVINDTTPTYTTYEDCSGACSASATAGSLTTPTVATSGVVSVDVGTLAPTGTVTLEFSVKIDE